MGFREPTNEEIREILLSAPYFEWPTFDHMPLNCFDLTSAVLTFPGDISRSRANHGCRAAGYRFDINDLSSCPRMHDFFDVELWNEESAIAPWFLGALEWSCLIDVNEFVLRQGFFSVGVAVSRFQNVGESINLHEVEQLKQASFNLLKLQIENETFRSININDLYVKNIKGRDWLVAQSLNQLNYPAYQVVSPIDHQTAILISATLDNSWFYGEVIPESVEQKHLASFWDFLGHIHLTYEHNGDLAVGSVAREAPGQAEKMDDLPEW